MNMALLVLVKHDLKALLVLAEHDLPAQAVIEALPVLDVLQSVLHVGCAPRPCRFEHLCFLDSRLLLRSD